MVIKILSHARKSGTFQNVTYDKIIFYGVSLRECYSSPTSTLSGHPIEFHEVSVSASKLTTVFPESINCELDSLIGRNIIVTYDVKTYGGKQHVVLDNIKFVPDSDTSDTSDTSVSDDSIPF